jgi:SAM-dependent methyltransferase
MSNFVEQLEERENQLFAQHKLIMSQNRSSHSLDLGCGPHPRNPFSCTQVYGVDIRSFPGSNILQAEIGRQKIPFEDDIFDRMTAFDVVEHIPRISMHPSTSYPFIALMCEIFRCLKVGGFFYSRTPAFPHPEAFQDPTHVNIITESTFRDYFCFGSAGSDPWARSYGFTGGFRLVYQDFDHCWLRTILEKV